MLLFLVTISSQEGHLTFIIEDLQDEYVLNEHLYIYEDKTCDRALSAFNDTLSQLNFVEYNNDFITNTQHCYWIRFNLKAKPGFNHHFKNWKLFIGEADFAEVYMLDGEGNTLELKSTGNWFPLSHKEEAIEYKEQRVSLDFKPINELRFYIKYQRKDHHNHKVNIRLQKYDFYQTLDYVYDTRQNWLFLGFVLTMLIFNFIFFASTRFIAFLYHGLFIAGTLIFTLDFFGITSNLYFIQDHPYLVQLVTVIGVALADIAYFQFIRYYLSLKDHMPKWDRILSFLVKVKLVFWPGIMVYYYLSYNEPFTDKLIVAFLVIQYVIIWTFLIFLLRSKHKNSLWLVLGNGFLFLLILINMVSLLNSTGISSVYTQLGVVGEILCFSIGLAYRFNDLRKEEEETLRLKELSQFKSQLLTNITHEFRTPLTIIQGASDLFRESLTTKVSNFDLNKAYNALERNSTNLLNLINEMLDLAKLEKKHVPVNNQTVDLVAVLNELCSSFKINAGKKNISLSFDTKEEELLLNTDLEKMTVVIRNLISNALKFTEPTGWIRVRLDIIQEESSAVIKISDSGIGIPKDKLKHIFQRFYQVKTEGKSEMGTGIGLSLVKELVELLEGTISVYSEENKGTEFTIVFPVQRDLEQMGEGVSLSDRQKEEEGIETTLFEKSKPILLIVEDNEDIQDYLEMLLSKEYSLRMANDGLEGLNLAEEIIPDLIISDLMMPKMDGISLCKRLKENEKTNHIPIIILTAKTAFEHKLEGLETGADAYLTKPFRKEELFIRLKKLNESRLSLQKKYSQFTLIESPKELKQENSFVHKVNAIIEDNLTNDQFGVEALAAALHMSRMQLHRKLTAVSDRSASNYIRSFRLYKAKPLILDLDKSISEVAWSVGFQDANYFSKSFQKEFGSTPSEYRKNIY